MSKDDRDRWERVEQARWWVRERAQPGGLPPARPPDPPAAAGPAPAPNPIDEYRQRLRQRREI